MLVRIKLHDSKAPHLPCSLVSPALPHTSPVTNQQLLSECVTILDTEQGISKYYKGKCR